MDTIGLSFEFIFLILGIVILFIGLRSSKTTSPKTNPSNTQTSNSGVFISIIAILLIVLMALTIYNHWLEIKG